MHPPAPVVVTTGSVDPTAPLVVLLHGIGQDESALKALADRVPESLAVALPRGPIEIMGGHNWFDLDPDANMRQETMRATVSWFRAWLDQVAPVGRDVVLVGFSAGAAFAAALVSAEPARYAGVALLSGSLPWFDGPDLAPGHWAELPVLLVRSEQDRIIPADLTERTWRHLLDLSGAQVETRVDPGKHEVTDATAAAVAAWLARLTG